MGSSAGRAAEADVVVTFGVLSMTVNLYTGESTVEKRAIKFRNCCPTCQADKTEAVGLNARYHCEHGHGPFETGDVLKGTEDDDGNLTIVGTQVEVKEQRSEFAELEKKALELEFLPREEVEENFYPATSTWVAQPKKQQPLFDILLSLMDDAGVIHASDGRELFGVGQIRMRDTEHVVRLGKWGDQLTFTKMFRPQDSKVFPRPISGEVSEKNMVMARTLIESQVVDFDADTYTDQARQRLVAWKAARTSGVVIPVAPKKVSKDPDADLSAMLEAAVAAAKEKAS